MLQASLKNRVFETHCELLLHHLQHYPNLVSCNHNGHYQRQKLFLYKTYFLPSDSYHLLHKIINNSTNQQKCIYVFRSRVLQTTGKGNSCSFRPSKVKPCGCRGKIILAPWGFLYFSTQPCLTRTRPFRACSLGTPAPNSRTNKKYIMLCQKQRSTRLKHS